MLFRSFARFLHFTPDKLSNTLCPQLGSKGTVQHDEVHVSNLMTLRDENIFETRYSSFFLGGVMLKAQ